MVQSIIKAITRLPREASGSNCGIPCQLTHPPYRSGWFGNIDVTRALLLFHDFLLSFTHLKRSNEALLSAINNRRKDV